MRPLAVAVTGGIGAGKSEALRAFARRGVPTLSADEVVHRLIAEDPEVRAALEERFGTTDRAGSARSSSPTTTSSPGSRGCSTRASAARRSGWLEALDAPVAATEIPLLYESGGDARFDAVVVITAPDEVRAARSRHALDQRAARLIPDEEKVRRADFAYVNDGTLEELDAFVGQVLDAADWVTRLLAGRLVLGADRDRGPARRLRDDPLHAAGLVRALVAPAPLPRDRARPRAELPPRPGAPRGGDLHGEQVRRRRPLGPRCGRPDAAPARDGEGDRRPHGRLEVPRLRPREPGDQRPLRRVVPAPPARQVRRRAARARRLQRGAGERRPLARAGAADPVRRDPRASSTASRA